MAVDIDVTILGPVGVTVNGAAVPLGDRKQRLLLSVLAHDLTVVEKNRCITCLWHDDEVPGDPMDQIHTYVKGIRAALKKAVPDGDKLLKTIWGTGYQLLLAPSQVDRHRFARWKAEAEAAERADPGKAARLARRALREWANPVGLRGGTPLADSPIEAFGNALQQDHRSVVLLWLRTEMACGRHELVLPDMVRLGADGYGAQDADLTRLHMIALFRAGRVPEALAVFDQHEEALGTELGVAPTKEMKNLAYQIGNDDDRLKLAPEDYAEYGDDGTAEQAPAPAGEPPAPQSPGGKFSLIQTGEKARGYQAESMTFHERDPE